MNHEEKGAESLANVDDEHEELVSGYDEENITFDPAEILWAPREANREISAEAYDKLMEELKAPPVLTEDMLRLARFYREWKKNHGYIP